MSETKRFFNELKSIYYANAWHGPALKEVLTGITAAQAKAKPITEGHSIWELVLHISGWNSVFLLALEGKSVNEPEGGDFPIINDTSENAWQKVLAQLDQDYEKFLSAISSLRDERLNDKVVGKDYNFRLMLRGIINHDIYHTGQIALLKKAK
ncbi:MAG: hypothetical protein FD167_3023 [bacterium]|nr:MAG: hypothetical protein FD167_3023 [bacterium]